VFTGSIPLNKCQRTRLAGHVAMERRGKQKLRFFRFAFKQSAGESAGQLDLRGKR
jgi:hypothetical protein